MEPTESDDDSSANTVAMAVGIAVGATVVMGLAVYAACKAGWIGRRGTTAGYTSVNFM